MPWWGAVAKWQADAHFLQEARVPAYRRGEMSVNFANATTDDEEPEPAGWNTAFGKPLGSAWFNAKCSLMTAIRTPGPAWSPPPSTTMPPK